MKKEFSFNYGKKQYIFEAKNDAVYELEKGITVKVVAKEYNEFDAFEWVLHFENQSDENSQIFSDINDCDTLLPLEFLPEPKSGYMPKDKDACVITMTGMVEGYHYWENDKVSATEYNFNREYLDKAPNKTKRFANICGRSSEGMMPFFDATANNNGYILAVGWTGDWKTEFAKLENGIHVKSGLKETHFFLKPGEKIRTSSVLIMGYTETEDKYNKFRSLINNYFSHKTYTESTRDSLLAFELWGGLTSEEMRKRIGELKANKVEFEEIWIDAGWYGQCNNCEDTFGDWWKYTGEWETNTRVHPDKFKEVCKAAEDAGMHLMLWFEPERAMENTKLTKEHPEWFLKIEGLGSDNYILNYGNREALEYVYALLDDYVEKLNLSCYRQDFNTSLSEYFKTNDEEKRRGITEIKHICGMYEIWDRLLKKHPELIIDNCASGGRRIDIETLKRSYPFFRSDYLCNYKLNAEVLQVHNSGISKYFPYNGSSIKTIDDFYAVRSSYSSSWGTMCYATIHNTMNEQDFVKLKKITDEYKKIRKYFNKDFYNHGSSVFDDTSWTVWQYHDSENQSGIVMAFRRSNSPFETVNIRLKGLCENKKYTLTNLDTNESFDYSDSLQITLPNKRSSVIIEYKEK